MCNANPQQKEQERDVDTNDRAAHSADGDGPGHIRPFDESLRDAERGGPEPSTGSRARIAGQVAPGQVRTSPECDVPNHGLL